MSLLTGIKEVGLMRLSNAPTQSPTGSLIFLLVSVHSVHTTSQDGGVAYLNSSHYIRSLGEKCSSKLVTLVLITLVWFMCRKCSLALHCTRYQAIRNLADDFEIKQP